MRYVLSSFLASLVVIGLASGGCSRSSVNWEVASSALGLTFQTLSPTIGAAATYVIRGGVAPFSISLTGLGSFTLQDPRTIQFQRPWLTGASQITVTDYLGRTVNANLSLNGGAIQLGGGGTPITTPLQFLRDGAGNLFIIGSTQAVMPGNQFGNLSNQYAYIAKIQPTGAVAWISQIGAGTASNTTGLQILQDGSGNSYLLGTTDNSLGGIQSGTQGLLDAFVAKFSTTGSLLWVNQLGGGGGRPTSPSQMVLDPTANVVVVGTTEGNLGGTQTGIHGFSDAFAAKFAPGGAMTWANQLGGGAASTTSASQVIVDGSGNLFILGNTQGNLGGVQAGVHGDVDAFVGKLASNGIFSWRAQIGGGGVSTTNGITLLQDAGGMSYVAGNTTGNLGGTQSGLHGAQDCFVSQFNTTGAYVWANQLGGGGVTNSCSAIPPTSVTASQDGAGNTYLLGTTEADLTPLSTQYGTHGILDAVLAKFSSAGALSWAIQLGGGNTTNSRSLILSAASVAINGFVSGNLGGTQLGVAGSQDAYVAQVSTAGVLSWTDQLGGGGVSSTSPSQLLVDAGGNIFLSGWTSGTLGGTIAGVHGNIDSFLVKVGSTGALAWGMQLGGGGSSSTYSSQISQDASGNIYLMGRATRTLTGTLIGLDNFENSYLAKINASGALQ